MVAGIAASVGLPGIVCFFGLLSIPGSMFGFIFCGAATALAYVDIARWGDATWG